MLLTGIREAHASFVVSNGLAAYRLTIAPAGGYKRHTSNSWRVL